MTYVVIMLTVLVLLLSVKVILLKRQMKHVVNGMKDNPDKRQLSVDFVDGDLQKMIVEVNQLYEYVLQIKAEGKEEECKIRESISMISHDMRTPLTSIIGYLQIAKKSADQKEMIANVDIALERARYLNKLVNDFFELSLIETDQVDMELEKVNLCEIICEEILAENVEIDAKGLEPRFDQAEQNVYVHADRKKLSRVIQNLISNAVKYSDRRLEFQIDREREGCVRLQIITDLGDKIDANRIFDRFVKGDSARSNGGAGLGLYICKRFVEMMGGTVKAEQDEKHFEITLTLPAHEA
ncbi:MAG: HAMP domain-containing histidine kinase [Lachnospiraceae bacterium]|nr:HAMP domain-containing histidine kinase [Lachnospiraceae bacterium]